MKLPDRRFVNQIVLLMNFFHHMRGQKVNRGCQCLWNSSILSLLKLIVAINTNTDYLNTICLDLRRGANDFSTKHIFSAIFSIENQFTVSNTNHLSHRTGWGHQSNSSFKLNYSMTPGKGERFFFLLHQLTFSYHLHIFFCSGLNDSVGNFSIFGWGS